MIRIVGYVEYLLVNKYFCSKWVSESIGVYE